MALELTLIFLFSLLFIAVIRHYAPKAGLVDIPNERSAHTSLTPRGAGIGFYLSVALVVPIFHYQFVQAHFLSLLAVLLVFIIGMLDDLGDTSPRTKFIVMFVATLFLYLDDIVITDIGIYFGIHLSLGYFALPFTLFSALTFTNALNLIDGLDGLAGSISMVILGSFFALGYLHDDIYMMVISGAFVSALAAFLIFNWQPASIFMGDSGSLTLGFVITMMAIKSLEYIPAISILFVAAIPIIDTTVVVMRRKRTGRGIFSADKCHLHHILYDFFGENTQKTVIFLTLMQVVYSLIGLQFAVGLDGGILLVLFLLNVIMIYYFSIIMIKKQKRICGEPKIKI